MIRSSFAEDPSWVAMTSPLQPIDPLDAYAAMDGAAVFWERLPGGESLAAFGAADSVEARPGDQPFSILDSLCRPGQTAWLSGGQNDHPPGLWWGGFAFDSRRKPTALWNGFPTARWILPELVIWRRGERSYATAFCSASGGLRQAQMVVRRRLESLGGEFSHRRSSEAGGVELGVSDRGAWDRLIHRALAAIEIGSISKVVAARRIRAHSEQPLNPASVLARLRQSVPECTLFSIRTADGATFLGATPETLLSVRGRLLKTEAIAGSAPRPGDPALASGDKEAREHKAVVDGIADALRPVCAELLVDAAPGVIGLPHLRHLRTAIRGRLLPEVPLSQLAAALHPTPSVGGVPRDRALRFLAEHEDLDRGWYAGPVGWVGEGAGELAVALRCALIRGGQVDLFVGAGVVEGSTAEGEWLETQAKSLTLLEALGGERAER
jgi:isochorismate synthase